MLGEHDYEINVFLTAALVLQYGLDYASAYEPTYVHTTHPQYYSTVTAGTLISKLKFINMKLKT